MLSLESTISPSNASVLIELLKQIQNTENSTDTTLLLEEIFSLLPPEIQTFLVSCSDISKALEELLQHLTFSNNVSIENHTADNLFGGKQTPIMSPSFENSPSSLKRKLSRAETIISNLELNLEDLKSQNSSLKGKFQEAIAQQGLLNSKIQKEKIKFKELSQNMEQGVLENQSKILKLKESLDLEIDSKKTLKENFSRKQADLQEEIRELVSQNHLLIGNVEKLKEDHEKLTLENQGVVKECIALKQRVQEYEENSVYEINAKNTLKIQLSRQEEEFNQKTHEFKEHIRLEKVERDNLASKLSEFKDNHFKVTQEFKNEIKELQVKLEKEQEDNTELFVKLNSSEESKSSLLVELRNEISVLRDKLYNEEQEKQELQKKFDDNLSEIYKMNGLCQSEKEIKLKLDIEYNHSIKKLEQVRKEKEILYSENQKLKENSESLLLNIKDELYIKEEEKEELLRNEIFQLNQLYQSECEIRTKLEIEYNDLFKHIEKLRMENETILNQNQNLQTKKDAQTLNIIEKIDKEVKEKELLQGRLESHQSELFRMNQLYEIEKETKMKLEMNSDELSKKLELMAMEKEMMFNENQKLKANNESLLLNVEIHTRNGVKIVILYLFIIGSRNSS